MNIENFLRSTNSGPALIDEYAPLCNQLLFNEPRIILDVTNKLKNNIIQHAQSHSKIYKSILPLYNRSNMKKEDWFVSDLLSENQIFSTSGSSSGEPFRYGVWNKYIRFLEDESHYGMILDEFNINKQNPKILILKKLVYNPKHEEFIHVEKGDSHYTLHTHKSINSTRYFVNFDDYLERPNEWFETLVEKIKPHLPFDIVMITGPIMSLMVEFFLKNNISLKLGKLMSQTGEFMRLKDKQTVLKQGYAEYVCDHMRCWDGGATFFTCKYDTYHLLDNLSWAEQGPDNKMLSTDYFNISAPFINYWNGDLCNIESDYKLCNCGRYYRPFKMLESRPFALKGPMKLTEIKKKINSSGFAHKINQVQFENLTISLQLNEKLNSQELYNLNQILKDYQIKIDNQ